jgi:alcohol dehydrogenase class IV
MVYDTDLSFVYRNPTRLVYGENTVGEIGQEVDDLGCQRAFVVTDRGVVDAGLTQRVEKALGRRHVGTYDGCIQDSSLQVIEEAAGIAKGQKADILVSVGGGSVIDTTKAMAILLTEGGRIMDHAGMQSLTRPQTPHIVVPTTAGTGSEVTYFAVVKDWEENRKMEFAEDHIIPNVGILDPTMTAGLPPMLTATTGMDAFSHALESIHTTQSSPVTDAMAAKAIEMIVTYLPRCVENGGDLFARGQQLMASTMAGIAFGNAQVALVHAMAHTVGGLFGVPHGMANSILLPHVVRFNLDVCAERYGLVARAMGLKTEGLSHEAVGEAVAEAISQFTRRIGIPQRLRDVEVPEEGLVKASEVALTQGPMVFNPKWIGDPQEVLGVFKKAW